MAMDGLVIHALVSELQSLVGGRIHKIHQPFERDIVLQIRGRGQNFRLLLSANPTYPRVHLIKDSYPNPMDAPMFCMLLRKYLENGQIENIHQVEMERIIHFDIRHRDELGDEQTKRLVVEIMGRHSNLILLDPSTGRILDGIHHVTPAISSYRAVVPGSTYIAPPAQHKVNPLDPQHHHPDQVTQALSTDEPEPGQLVAHFGGLSPLAAQEIVFRGLAQLPDMMQDIAQGRYTPQILHAAHEDKQYFAIYTLTHLDGQSESFDSVSACLDSYYSDKARKDRIKQRVGDLYRMLTGEKTKAEKKINKLQQTMEEAGRAEQFRLQGELLTAALHTIKRGDSQAEVLNYYDEDQAFMIIALDPQLTPAENAQRLFKKYTKAKNSIEIVTSQIAQSEAEITYFDTLLQQLDSASLHDIEEIRQELMEQGYLRRRNLGTTKKRKEKKNDKPNLHRYQSSEGIDIYVGKNNIQNEYLTNRLARPNDTWLHAKDMPGSHVVIRSDNFSDATLEDAAQLAAYFSKGKNSSHVPIDYTRIRHVHKPSGAKPGFVIYEQQKTLMITPDNNRIATLSEASGLKSNV